MATHNGLTDTAPLLRGGSFQASSSATVHPIHDVSDETPESSRKPDETIEGPRTEDPAELPLALADEPQRPRQEDTLSALPARTASSISTAKLEEPPSMHNRRSTGEYLKTIREDLSFPRIKPVILPFACLMGGVILALGHHLFNNWADGRTVGKSPNIPQQWVLRVGIAFAFAFQTILAASLSFVVCQILLYYARRKYMTLQDLNALYLVERRDVVPTFLSNALVRAPFLVLVVTFSLLLPIAAIFSPASLSVVFLVTNTSGPCVVSAANITDGANSTHIYSAEDGFVLSGVSGPALKITQRALVGVIPSLPMFCGDNCIYEASMDSMTFECQEGVTLPAGQMGTVDPAHPGPGTRTYWNATSDGTANDPTLPFYVGWMTNAYTDGMEQYLDGTSGSAYCTPMLAHYNFSVQWLNGVQTVSYTTDVTGPMPPSTHFDQNNDQPTYAALQIGAIGLAARNHLLGSLSITSNPAGSHDDYNSSVISASFLNVSTIGVESYVWGDVVGGIQETAANITASMLQLNLGGMKNSTCIYTNQNLVYAYHWLGLWIPYGIALLIVASSLIFGVLIFLRFNPQNLTTSLSDTVSITQNPTFATFAHKRSSHADQQDTRFRLGEQADGSLGFATQKDFS